MRIDIFSGRRTLKILVRPPPLFSSKMRGMLFPDRMEDKIFSPICRNTLLASDTPQALPPDGERAISELWGGLSVVTF